MKLTQRIAIVWKGSRAARLCAVAVALSLLRFTYLWHVPGNLTLAWLDLFMIPIMGGYLIAGWVALCRQFARGRKKQAEPIPEILACWDNEIRALSWELWEAGQHQRSSEQIEAIQRRIDEAHQRRERERENLRKQ